MLYLKLYLLMLYVAGLGFGGAYSIWALLRSEVVVECGINPKQQTSQAPLQVCSQEFNTAMVLSEILPGPQVNAMAIVAFGTFGIPGMALCVAALLTPGLVCLPLLLRFYGRVRESPHFRNFFTGAVLVALAILVLFFLNISGMLVKGVHMRSAAVILHIAAAFWFSHQLKLSPLLIVAVCGASGYFIL